MQRAPIEGPMMRVRFWTTLTPAIAWVISDGGTMYGTIDVMAGWDMAWAAPPRAASPSSRGMVWACNVTSTPIATGGPAMTTLPAITNLRRSKRSAIDPATGDKNSDGENWATRLRATANGHELS